MSKLVVAARNLYATQAVRNLISADERPLLVFNICKKDHIVDVMTADDQPINYRYLLSPMFQGGRLGAHAHGGLVEPITTCELIPILEMCKIGPHDIHNSPSVLPVLVGRKMGGGYSNRFLSSLRVLVDWYAKLIVSTCEKHEEGYITDGNECCACVPLCNRTPCR